MTPRVAPFLASGSAIRSWEERISLNEQRRIESKGRQMRKSRRSSVNEIPRDIREQEAEIESIFRNLIRFSEGSCLHHRQFLPNDKLSQNVLALEWILIAMLGAFSVIAFVILWLKV